LILRISLNLSKLKNEKMKKSIYLVCTLFLVIAFSCKNEKKEETSTESTDMEEVISADKAADMKTITVDLEPKSGSSVTGNVVFTQQDGKVTMVANMKGLQPGEHAIHLHEKADCSAEDATSTGGHWNPTFENHGKWGSAEGYHKGDIGNITADENGLATLTFETDEWCIGCGDDKKDIVGRGIIVHEGADDFTTQPTGNAGGRVTCGGIIE
jgi:Cu-Zn family superoxide dismutase